MIRTLLLLLIAKASFADTSKCVQIYHAYNLCQQNFKFDPTTGYFSFKDGTRLKCSDGQNLDFYERLQNMDVASILQSTYPENTFSVPLSMNGDPGRLRIDTLFKSTYGQDEKRVYKNLVTIEFLGRKVTFNKNNGAARALIKVNKLLLVEAERNAEVRAFLEPWLSGNLKGSTYNWRFVKGTTRLSTHSFGTGIDLNNPEEKKNVYWLWDIARQKKIKADDVNEPLELGYVPQNIAFLPERIVEIFESQGFIWGGKWYHYDLMHFEYRPEFFPGYQADCRL